MYFRIVPSSVLMAAFLAAAASASAQTGLALPPMTSSAQAQAAPLTQRSIQAQTSPSASSAPNASTAPPVGVQVTARSTATIAAPMAGQLTEFPAADGDAVKEGQILAKFNCAQQAAAAGRSKAELNKRQDMLSTQTSLKALNAYSKSDYVIAQNDVEVAKADLDVAQTVVDNCTIRAPFSGRVSSAPVRNFQFVQAGAPLLDIVDDRDLELEFIVPSIWLAWLKVSAVAHVQVSETQQSYDAQVTRISGKVDAASQTIKIYGHIDGDTSSLLPGMSGTAHFVGATH
jgi:membrane fusion protein, multidrug efflux system